MFPTPKKLMALMMFFLLAGGAFTGPASAVFGPGPCSGASDIYPAQRAERAIPVRPDVVGPYTVGYMYEQFKGSTKSYYISLRIFYPAQSTDENATPNGTGAPFATIIQLPFFGGPAEAYNFVAPQIVSWGFVSVVVGVNWNDFPFSANVTDMEEILTQLENDNASPVHKLSGMIDKSKFGISGYSSGGGISILDGALVPRIKAVQACAAAIGISTVNALAPYFNKPIQLQAGQNDSQYRPNSVQAYKVFPPPKAFLDTRDGTHGGPFYWDLVIAFFHRYLNNDTDYEHYLYQWGAMDDVANLNYTLSFTLPNGTFFPGNVSIAGSPLAVNETEPVSLSAQYTGYMPLGHPRLAFQWDFSSDGTVDASDPQNLTATGYYNRSGYQRVGMWCGIGDFQLRCNNTLLIQVTNIPPTVSIGYGYFADEDRGIIFFARGNDTPYDNDSLEFSWQFGDGASLPFAPNNIVNHAYKKAGNYTLNVTVRDIDGATALASSLVRITNLAPSALAGSDIFSRKDEPVNFSGLGGDTFSDAPQLEFSWDFGDGTTSGWSASPNATHTYTRAGNFTGNFTVRDDNGETAIDSLTVTVSNAAPTARITNPTASVFWKDDPVEFFGEGGDTPTDAPSLLYRWDFGDGNTTQWATAALASHTYTHGGNYTVTLTVQDGDGDTGQSSMNLTLNNRGPKLKLVSPVQTEAEEDEVLVFSATGEDTESDIVLLNFTWEMDNGKFYGPLINHSFSTEGAKFFRLTVRDTEGAAATVNGTVTIRNRVPWISISIGPDKVFENDTINYSAVLKDTPSDIPTMNISWEFGDGEYSALLCGTHVYKKSGAYTIRLTVTDDEGQVAQKLFTVKVETRYVPPPPKPPKPVEPVKSEFPFAYAAGAAAAVAVALVLAVIVIRKAPGAGQGKLSRYHKAPPKKDAPVKEAGPGKSGDDEPDT